MYDTIRRMKKDQNKFTYPMWFKSSVSHMVVMFNSITEGVVIESGTGKHSIGSDVTFAIGHIDDAVWTQIDEPIKQWEPQGGLWYVHACGEVGKLDKTTNTSFTSHGAVYKTEEQAEYASKQMRVFNRLLSYVAEFDNGWTADWNNEDRDKYCVLL